MAIFHRSPVCVALVLGVIIGVVLGNMMQVPPAEAQQPVPRPGPLAALELRIAALEHKLASVSADESGNVYFTGVNVHIRNATGHSDQIDGRGNLILGYNESFSGNEQRGGSHNFVIGRGHAYSNYGGFVAGEANTVTGSAASVSGGHLNLASGNFASVGGGESNEASHEAASVSGGVANTAAARYASISGGTANLAIGDASSISGGFLNLAGGSTASITGGHTNVAQGDFASVGGGFFNLASGNFSSVSGGNDNVASHVDSTVSGGIGNETAADGDHVP